MENLETTMKEHAKKLQGQDEQLDVQRMQFDDMREKVTEIQEYVNQATTEA